MSDPYPQEQTVRDGRDLIAATIRSKRRHLAYPPWATGPAAPEAARAAMPSVDGLHGQSHPTPPSQRTFSNSTSTSSANVQAPDSLQQLPPVHMYHESHSFSSSYSSYSSYSSSSSFATLATAPIPDPAPPPAYVHFHGHSRTSPLASTHASAASLQLPPETPTPMDLYPPSAPTASTTFNAHTRERPTSALVAAHPSAVQVSAAPLPTLPVHDADDERVTRWRPPVFGGLVEGGQIARAPVAGPAPALVRTLQLVDQDPLVLVRPAVHEYERVRVRVHLHDLAHALDSLARGIAACTDPAVPHTPGPRDAPGAAVAAEACAGHVARAAIADELAGVAERKDNHDGEKDGGVGRVWEHSKQGGQGEDRGRTSDDEEAHLGSEDQQEDPDTWFKRVVGSTTDGWNVYRTSDAVQAAPEEHVDVRGHALDGNGDEREVQVDKEAAYGYQEIQGLDSKILALALAEGEPIGDQGPTEQARGDSPSSSRTANSTTTSSSTTVTLHNLPASSPTWALLSLLPSFAKAPLDVIPLAALAGATVHDVKYVFADESAAQGFAEYVMDQVERFGNKVRVTMQGGESTV